MDFAGASLRLKAEGEDKVIATLDRIDKKAQESVGGWSRLTQQELDKASAKFDELYGKQSRSARATQQVVEDVATKVDASMARSSRGVLAASRALEVMGRTGKETGRSLDTLLSQVGFMAFGFGAQGALVGAVAIGTAAIVEMFNRVSAEMEKLHEKFDRETEAMMRHGSLMAVDARRGELYAGAFSIREEGESDVAFIGRSQGLRGPGGGLEGLARQTNAQIDSMAAKFGKGMLDAKLVPTDVQVKWNKLNETLEETNRLIGLKGTEWSQLGQREATEMQVAADRARIELDKLDSRLKKKKHVSEFGDTDPYRKTETETLGRGALDPAYAAMAKLAATIPDPVKEWADKMKADQAADTFQIRETVDHSLNAIKDMWFAKSAKLAEDMKARLAATIGNALQQGLTAAFAQGGNIGAGIKTMTQTILGGLASMLMEIAEKALAASVFMQKLYELLPTNPWAAAAVAAAMIAFAASMGGSRGGGGGGGYSSGGYAGSGNTVIDRGIINPMAPPSTVTNPSSIQARPTINLNATIIGTRDPKAMREIQELINHATRRGNV
jgi:hypothetical protein